MGWDTITREEFDRRLDAANERRAQELRTIEEQQARAEGLLSHYERTLTEIEVELDAAPESPSLSASLRRRLNELAERTAQVAATV